MEEKKLTDKSISFTNKDTCKELTLSLEDENTFIFGGNGTGKTTLSREFSNYDNCLVFNSDYVNKNVFIMNTDGASCDAKSKENFSNIFLGEDSVELAEKVSQMSENLKELSKKNDKILQDVNTGLLQEKLASISDMKTDIIDVIKYTFKYNQAESFEENKKNFQVIQKLPTNINNQKEYEKNLVIYNEGTIRKDIVKKIDGDKNLKEIFSDKKYKLLEDEISNYNSFYKLLNELETDFSKYDSKKEVIIDWIKTGLKIHGKSDTCIFCGNTNIEAKKAEWEEKIKNEYLEQKDLLLEHLKTIRDSVDSLLQNKEMYNKIAPKIIETCENISNEIGIIKERVSDNKNIEVKELSVNKDNIYTDTKELLKNLMNYYINEKHLNSITYIYLYYNDYKKELSTTKKDLNNKNSELSESIAKNINEISSRLKFSKDILIECDNRGNTPKLSIKSDKGTGKLANYSEGQLHKLALAVFFVDVENRNEKIDFLILDDPVVSLDITTYHALKSLIIEFSAQKKFEKLVIMTHNIQYLYIQASNLIGKNNLSMYEIKPDRLKRVDPKILTYDDVLLYKKLLNDVEDADDLSLVYWMSLKILRMFLDLKLRMEGIAYLGNPSEEIEKLTGVDDKDALKKLNKDVCNICRKTDVTVSQALKGIEDTNEFIENLGFSKFIVIDELHKFDDNEKTSELKMYPSLKEKGSILQTFALFTKRICFSDDKNYKNIKHYLDHPRHQITKSVVGIEGSIDY